MGTSEDTLANMVCARCARQFKPRLMDGSIACIYCGHRHNDADNADLLDIARGRKRAPAPAPTPATQRPPDDERDLLRAVWTAYTEAGMPGGYYAEHDWTAGNLMEALHGWGSSSNFDGELLAAIWRVINPNYPGGYPIEGPVERNRIYTGVKALANTVQAQRVALREAAAIIKMLLDVGEYAHLDDDRPEDCARAWLQDTR